MEDRSWNDDGSVNWPAYRLAAEAAQVLGYDDPVLADLWDKITLEVTLESDPPGAEVFIRPYAGNDAWERLGVTPIEGLPLPGGFSRLRFELADHAVHEDVLWVNPWMRDGVEVTLHSLDATPDGMVWIRPYERPLGLPGLEALDAERVDAFWADTHEVTNREYKQFVDELRGGGRVVLRPHRASGAGHLGGRGLPGRGRRPSGRRGELVRGGGLRGVRRKAIADDLPLEQHGADLRRPGDHHAQ
jgi:hypothetical protein